MPDGPVSGIAPSERVCTICGHPLLKRRSHARVCSGSCRAEASRLKAIIDGTYTGSYRSVAERLAKSRSTSPLGKSLTRSGKALESAHKAAEGHRSTV